MEQAKVTKISKEDYSQIGEEEKARPLKLNHPNQEFLRLYCEKEMSAYDRSPMVLIRHAYSNYNHAMKTFNDGMTTKGPESHQEYIGLRSSKALIDPALHEIGVKQARDQQDLVNRMTFSKVFVSPHVRTIQSAALMLSSHPQKQDMVLVLLPLAKEIMHTSNDLGLEFKDLEAFTSQISKEHGVKFDFSLFEPFRTKGIDSWYYQVLSNVENREHLMRQCEDKHPHDVGCEAMATSGYKCIEDNHEIFDRV